MASMTRRRQKLLVPLLSLLKSRCTHFVDASTDFTRVKSRTRRFCRLQSRWPIQIRRMKSDGPFQSPTLKRCSPYRHHLSRQDICHRAGMLGAVQYLLAQGGVRRCGWLFGKWLPLHLHQRQVGHRWGVINCTNLCNLRVNAC